MTKPVNKIKDVRVCYVCGVTTVVDVEQERKAQEALAKAGITGPPVNPIAVAKALGYSVYWNRFEDRRIHGSVTFDKGKARIDVDERDPLNRRRFTIAHEIGHAVNHMLSDGFASMSDGVSAGLYRTEFSEHDHPVVEIEANDFAGSLLMPAEWFTRSWEKTRDVSALAQEFRVSKKAVEVRLKKLGLHS